MPNHNTPRGPLQWIGVLTLSALTTAYGFARADAPDGEEADRPVHLYSEAAFRPAPPISDIDKPSLPPVSPGLVQHRLPELRSRVRTGNPLEPQHAVDESLLALATTQARSSSAALGRMRRYDALIRQALVEHGLPLDLAYLPLVESEFKPTAVSHAGAAGLWQFMPETARAEGLIITPWVDERLDPVRSTPAAARHLRSLFRTFGSWHLALAAYNAGTGRVLDAIPSRSQFSDTLYWRIRASLPAETRAYVPKVLAAVELGAHPLDYGLAPSDSTRPMSYRVIRVPPSTSMERIASTLHLAPTTIRDLNPHLIRGVTPPGGHFDVRIPD